MMAHPYFHEAVKKFKTGRGREGEPPAEPHGARTCRGDGSPGGSPSQFSQTFPPKRRFASIPVFRRVGPSPRSSPRWVEGNVTLDLTPSPPSGERVAKGRVRGPLKGIRNSFKASGTEGWLGQCWPSGRNA